MDDEAFLIRDGMPDRAALGLSGWQKMKNTTHDILPENGSEKFDTKGIKRLAG